MVPTSKRASRRPVVSETFQWRDLTLRVDHTFATVPVLAALVVVTEGVGWWITLPFPLAIVYLAESRHNLLARALAHPLMVTLGNSSYAAFMVHGPLQLITYKLVPFSQFVDAPLPLRIAIAFAYPIAMIIAGVAAHVLFEHPARAYVIRRLKACIHGPERSA